VSDAREASQGQKLAEISNAIVSLHRRYYGKGPNQAKTYLVDDTVVCVLWGGFTTVEATLIDQGRADAVLEIRRTFQSAMESQSKDVIEQALDRKVVAYLSQVHTDPDFAIELFMLEPSGNSEIGKFEQKLTDAEERS
jgi:uncharacterized protein YbcI